MNPPRRSDFANLASMADPPQYSRKLDEAVQLAMDGFRTKIRKGTGVPYLTHLLQVMVTVGEAGGDE